MLLPTDAKSPAARTAALAALVMLPKMPPEGVLRLGGVLCVLGVPLSRAKTGVDCPLLFSGGLATSEKTPELEVPETRVVAVSGSPGNPEVK